MQYCKAIILQLKVNQLKKKSKHTVQFGHSVVTELSLNSCLFVTPWTAACQASLSATNSRSLLKLTFIDAICLILCRPYSSCLQSFPASGSFPMSHFFTSIGQSIGVSASASVLPMNIQGWFPLGLTGLILKSKGLLRIFSNTTVQKHQFFSTSVNADTSDSGKSL